MPANATDNFPRFVRSNSDLCGGFHRNGNGICSPRALSSPHSPPSPGSASQLYPTPAPFTTLRRSFSSTFTLIPEERSVSPERPEQESSSLLYRLITWYPFFVLSIVQKIISAVFHPAWGQMLVVLPTLWISAWLWIFWKSIQWPLNMLKWFITALYTPTAERNRRKRTVMLSSGSSVQTLHLARNFYTAGARVIVFEIEGHFALSKFSTAVEKFYTIPKPSTEDPQAYIRSLCQIVEQEKVSYYVPVCATSSAYFDAVAKPHIELMACSCFHPNLKDVTILDDILEVLQRCQNMGLPTPNYTAVSSKDDIDKWYENVGPRTGKHFMASVGALGIRERVKFSMPVSRRDFRLHREVSQERLWTIVQDMKGDHYLTCTTVKDSQVIANVTCRIDSANKGLVHENNREIEAWLKQFFNKLTVYKPITGHLSFRFVKDSVTGLILPLGIKVGVSLPYICHTSVHSRLLWRPCPHFNRHNSGPIVASAERYWMHEAVLNTLRHPSVEAVGKLIGTVLDKREALFAYWDPLPYCAYYHFHLPFDSVLGYTTKKKDVTVTHVNANGKCPEDQKEAIRPRNGTIRNGSAGGYH